MRRPAILAGRVTVLTVAVIALADTAALSKDLTAMLVRLGLPCGQVMSAYRQADGDHITRCKSGERYRVVVDAEGRVVASTQ